MDFHLLCRSGMGWITRVLFGSSKNVYVYLSDLLVVNEHSNAKIIRTVVQSLRINICDVMSEEERID